MRIRNLKLALLALALCAPVSMASAQEAAPAEGASTTPTVPPPEPMVSDTPPVQEPEKKGLEVSFTWGLSIGVPIFLAVENRSVVRPGAALNFFGAADFGWFAIGGDAGLQWNPIDFGGGYMPPGSGITLTGRSPLTRIYLSAPEFRFQVPNLPVVLPYLSGSFDMNFWNFRETTVGCGYWYCSSYSVYRFTPGFTGKAGLGFNINESGVHIDVGFQYSFTGKGNFFEQTHWWLAPYVGVLIRHR